MVIMNRPITDKHNFFTVNYGTPAVSYTHLDVYKRQFICRAQTYTVLHLFAEYKCHSKLI